MKKFKKAILLGLSLLMCIPFLGNSVVFAKGPKNATKLEVKNGKNCVQVLSQVIKKRSVYLIF